MPRNNKEPFNCAECRFNIDGFCKRNSPVVTEWHEVYHPVSRKYEKVKVWGFPEASLGCFAGEPVERVLFKNCVSDCKYLKGVDEMGVVSHFCTINFRRLSTITFEYDCPLWEDE